MVCSHVPQYRFYCRTSCPIGPPLSYLTVPNQRAKDVLEKNRKLLDTIADYLIKVETLTKQDIDEIVLTGNLKRYDDNNGLVDEETITLKPTKDNNEA